MMRRALMIVLAAVLASSSAFAEVVGWRGDGTGHFPKATPPLKWNNGANVVWKTELPNYSASSAIVVGDRVFTASKEYDLVCLDKKTGRILWVRTSSPYDAATPADRAKSPEVWKQLDGLAARRDGLNAKIASGGGAFAAGQQKYSIEKEMDKLLKGIDGQRYRKMWRSDGGMANGTPSSDGENVYVWNATGVMACYDLGGERKWINHQPRAPQEHSYHGSPLLVAGKVVIGMRVHLGFDMKTGKLAWESEPFQSGNMLWYGNQVAATVGGRRVFVSGDGSMWDPATGKRLGKSPGASSKNNCTPVVGGGYVCLIGCSYPNKWDKQPVRFYRLPGQPGGPVDMKRPEYPWGEKRILGDITGSPLYHEGLMYIVTTLGTFFVYDVETVALVYRQKIDFEPPQGRRDRPYGCGVQASPALAGGRIYIWGNFGTVLVIEPGRQYKQLAKNTIETRFDYNYKKNILEGTASSPFFDGNHIFYRAQKHMYCIGEPGKPFIAGGVPKPKAKPVAKRPAAKRPKSPPRPVRKLTDEQKAKGLLSGAENYIRAGMGALARKKLAEVIEKYPGTSAAATAKKKLAALNE